MEPAKNSIADLASDWSDAVAQQGLRIRRTKIWRELEKVTPEDVNRVARKYLDLAQAVTVTMTPQGRRPSRRPKIVISAARNPSLWAKPSPSPLPDWAESALNRLDVPQSTLHPTVTTLPNGITLIVQPENVSDTVSVYGHIENRPETETATGKEGVAEVVNAMFKYGSEHLDRIVVPAGAGRDRRRRARRHRFPAPDHGAGFRPRRVASGRQ